MEKSLISENQTKIRSNSTAIETNGMPCAAIVVENLPIGTGEDSNDNQFERQRTISQ